MTSHKDLVVWRKSIILASKVYAAARRLPSRERFGLSRQLRRAATSIPSAIAEGAARRSRAEFVQFLHVARGALAQLETHVLIAIEQGFMTPAESPIAEIEEVARLLNGLVGTVLSSSKAVHAKACAPQRPLTANR